MQSKVASVVSSKRFFYAIIGLLIFQSLWIALSGRYPMAFDEDFHFGIIKLYAHHISPIWSGQPAGGDAFGAVFRDPSYLYQYLMSFPYRFISLFTSSQTIQVLLLRFISIGLFASCLPLYRTLLLKTKASAALVHTVLLFFVLIPIVPLLAAEINYDTLLLPVTAGVLLQAYSVAVQLRTKAKLSPRRLALLVASCLLGSIVKYAFLPIFAAIAVYLAIEVYLSRELPFNWPKLARVTKQLSMSTKWLLIVLLLLSATLFTERYGVNTVRYHNPIPSCGQVLSYQHCSSYGPWIRDYNYAAMKVPTNQGPIIFLGDWIHGMWQRLFFSLAGPNINYQTRGPFPLPAISAVVFAGLGLLLASISFKKLWRAYDHSMVRLLSLVTVLYVAILWLDDLRDYLYTGVPVAINGRYLLPILPFVMLLLAMGYRHALARLPRLQIALATVAFVCFIWGGGFLTFVLRSNDAWYWPNATVRTVNHALQRVLDPITPGSNDPTEFL